VLKHIEEFGMHIEIAGFKNVKIKNVDEFLNRVNKEKPANVEIQFFDAKLVATWQHLYFAVLNALTAFNNKQGISKSLAMEIILYASAQGQIRKATELIGIKPNSSNIAVLIVGGKSEAVKSALSKILKCINGECDDAVLELSKEKATIVQKAFQVSEAELETVMGTEGLERALIDLVIERMALLATHR
jgi:tRNA threonylcarbamoyladenosine modification (KEOPS) complex Cgi121 subunit